jgi:hypothetical protein
MNGVKWILAFVLAPVLFAQTAPPADKPTVPKLTDVNAEVLDLVIQDAWDRGTDMFGGRSLQPRPGKIEDRDEQRRQAVRKLVNESKLQSARDFFFAALVLQHSGETEDTILAHVLATTAAAKGAPYARWLAAASLDRYLWLNRQPQVFGTQFTQPPGGEWTMEPYNRTAVTDAVRALWCVAPQATQDQVLADVKKGQPLTGTSVSDCK